MFYLTLNNESHCAFSNVIFVLVFVFLTDIQGVPQVFSLLLLTIIHFWYSPKIFTWNFVYLTKMVIARTDYIMTEKQRLEKHVRSNSLVLVSSLVNYLFLCVQLSADETKRRNFKTATVIC